VVLVAGAAWVGFDQGGTAARSTGFELYQHRGLLTHLREAATSPPQVVWVGDSTLMGFPALPSYANLVQRDLLDRIHVRSLILTAAGLDFFGYWGLAGRIAALQPDVVVLVANLRNFSPAGTPRGFNDLMAEIDWDDLPETLALPYNVRGMTMPRVLLARLLRTEAGEDMFLRYEGLRRNVQESAVWRWLGAAEPPPTEAGNFRLFARVASRTVAAFDRPLGPRQPLVRFAGATVARLVRAGASVLVLVTPIPWETAASVGHYEQQRFEARIQTLREVVVANGGRLVDLHRVITHEGFRDFDCHLTADGAAEVAKRIGPYVLNAVLQQRGLREATSGRLH
jgi:hypothetical protein